MSEAVQIRISQYGVVAKASVTRDQLMLNKEELAELAKELHRDAVWACLQRLGADSALSWRQILDTLEAERARVMVELQASRPRKAAVMSDSAAMSLSTFENIE